MHYPAWRVKVCGKIAAGAKSLRWVLAKAYQHTLEHTDEVLRSVLWWDGDQ